MELSAYISNCFEEKDFYVIGLILRKVFGCVNVACAVPDAYVNTTDILCFR